MSRVRDWAGGDAVLSRSQTTKFGRNGDNITDLPLHDTVLKRYRVAAGSARPLRDYLPLRDFSIIHDYRLPRDPSYPTTFPSFTTTAYSTIPLAIWLPESRAAPTIPPTAGRSRLVVL